jgi:hypothetical protein
MAVVIASGFTLPPQGSLMPITLDETKGQVPVFYSEKVSFTLGGETRFPFFLR